MVIQVSKTKSYIPTFNGNKDISPAEQIVVTYKNPTVQMRERLIPRPQSKGKASTTGAVETFEIVLSEPNKQQILKEMIQTISNCSYEEDGQIKNINNATELLNAPSEFNGLVDELFGQCQKELQKTVPEKKLAIAFRAYKEGIYKHEYKGRRANVLWNSRVKDSDEKEIFIKRKDINSYLDEYFWSALNVYYMTENMQCLPFAGGWAEQPYEIVTVISLFRVEQSKWEKEELDKKLKK